MKKVQVNVRLDEATHDQLDSLTADYGTITTAVEIAIDRLWLTEEKPEVAKCNGDTKQINIRLSAASISKLNGILLFTKLPDYPSISAVVRTAIRWLHETEYHGSRIRIHSRKGE